MQEQMAGLGLSKVFDTRQESPNKSIKHCTRRQREISLSRDSNLRWWIDNISEVWFRNNRYLNSEIHPTYTSTHVRCLSRPPFQNWSSIFTTKDRDRLFWKWSPAVASFRGLSASPPKNIKRSIRMPYLQTSVDAHFLFRRLRHIWRRYEE